MKPAPFAYERATTTEDALAALARAGEDARFLAGGQSLVVMLNMRLVQPKLLVDISRVEALRGIRIIDGQIQVGAATRQAELLAWPELTTRQPLLAEAMPWIGHVQTRSKGTVGGSIAHADPSSELPLCLAVLGGEIVLRSTKRRRTLPAAEFQTGMLSTARTADELLESVRFPLMPADTRYAFEEFGLRHGDFAIVAVAVAISPKGLRIGIGGVADRPAIKDFPPLSGSALDDALNAFAWELGGQSDQHATARYRRELVRRLGRRAVLRAQGAQ